MLKISIDKNASFIIKKLTSAGFSAYAVGGCIRDCIMGKQPHDWDITTNAQPQQIKQIFGRTIDTGIKHGTVTVLIDKKGYEITTFRTGSGGFADSIETDLSYRDFTVNAMAYGADGIVDLFGGTDDIKNKTIRAVKNPADRFDEDPLRMLRAVRFAAVLGFEIEDETYKAISAGSGKLKSVSIERIRDEFFKILLSDRCEMLAKTAETGLCDSFAPFMNDIAEKYDINKYLCMLNNTDKVICLRLAWLLKPLGAKGAESFLKKMRADNKTAANTAQIIRYADFEVTDSYTAGKLMSCTDLYRYVLEIQKINLLYCEKSVNSIEKSIILCNNIINNCHTISDLDIDGKDLIGIGIQGREIGEMLNMLLDMVLHHPQNNVNKVLMEYAKELKK